MKGNRRQETDDWQVAKGDWWRAIGYWQRMTRNGRRGKGDVRWEMGKPQRAIGEKEIDNGK